MMNKKSGRIKSYNRNQTELCFFYLRPHSIRYRVHPKLLVSSYVPPKEPSRANGGSFIRAFTSAPITHAPPPPPQPQMTSSLFCFCSYLYSMEALPVEHR